MAAYWKSVFERTGSAAFDVLFVAIISLAPLLIGRIAFLVREELQPSEYWMFLWNGQLSFFSMGSLATLLLLCFRKKLPNVATLAIGCFSVGCLLFLVALVGIDPSLHQAQMFVGPAALFLYLAVIAVRIVADAMKSVEPSDALRAGNNVSRGVQKELSERMSGKMS